MRGIYGWYWFYGMLKIDVEEVGEKRRGEFIGGGGNVVGMEKIRLGVFVKYVYYC